VRQKAGENGTGLKEMVGRRKKIKGTESWER